jgi:hypothetical protein
MSAIFEADPEGFRAMQMGRPAAHLVRELVQNVFDEAAGFCRVTVATPRAASRARRGRRAGRHPRREADLHLWASDKADADEARPDGAGLKELVSVSERTVVATQGGRDRVHPQGGEWKRSHTTHDPAPALGHAHRAPSRGWKAKDAKEIVKYLRRVRPPFGITFT